MKLTDEEVKALDMSKQKIVMAPDAQWELVLSNPTAAHLVIHIIILPDGNHCFTTAQHAEAVLESMAEAYKMKPAPHGASENKKGQHCMA
jgi:hypothetical protein